MKKSVTHPLVLATAMAVFTLSPAANADITGNINVVSKYVLRGMTNDAEHDGTAVQGGFDWSHKMGFYAGYWGSNLDYGATRTSTTNTGFENDIYGGYKFKAGPVDLNLGVIYYLYTQVLDSDAAEVLAAAGIGPVTLAAKYLTKDVSWGNTGDIYLTLDFVQELPAEFKFNAQLGYYVYEDRGDFIPTTVENSAFRHLNLGVSHPFGKTGANMSVTYIVGGESRQGVQQGNAVVLALGMGF